MKKILYFFVIIIISGAPFDTAYALKRKFESEKEKETELVEIKKPKTEIYSEPTSLKHQAARKVIDNFLHANNEKELQKTRAEYARLIPEIQEYIKDVVTIPNAMGETYLHNAKNHWQVEQLMFLGADPYQLSKLKQVPLISMVAKGNIEAAETLLKILGIEPKLITDITSFTLLDYALMTDAVNLVRRILENPENTLRIQDIINATVGLESGLTPLILAAQYSPLSIKPLLEKGAAINQPNGYEATALLYAAEFQPARVIKYLVENGAQLDREDNEGANALAYAVKGNNTEVIHY